MGEAFALFLTPTVLVVGLVIVLWFRRNSRRTMIMRLFRDDRGQDLIEYAMMSGFVAMVAVAIMPSVAVSIKAALGRACATIDGVAYVATPLLPMDPMTFWIRIGCAVLAVVLLGVIVLRRVKNPDL